MLYEVITATAGMPAGEVLGEDMSLDIDEIADIARRLDGAALTEDMEEYP